MRLPATAKWIGLALLGLAIAVAVAIAAGNLASQQIGIASESISAGEELAPAVGGARPGDREPADQLEPTTTPGDRTATTTEQTTTEPTTTTDETTTESTEPVEPGHDGGDGDDSGGDEDD
ncbi:MAG: hypothetical protein WD810_09405 [Solirubrobacterales bacterium]